MRDEICKLCEIGQKSYYVWKNKNHIKLIKLLEKYFTKEDLVEFLQTGKIQKFEKLEFSQNLLSHYRDSYFSYIHSKMRHINSLHDYILRYYFQYLYYLKTHLHQFEISKRPFHAAAISFALKQKNEFSQNEIDSFHLFIDLVDFLDDEAGMWFYFSYLLQNDMSDFLEGVDLSPFLKNGKIVSFEIDDQKDYTDKELEEIANSLETKNPISVQGLDHYYFYHCYNNIAPYSIAEVE